MKLATLCYLRKNDSTLMLHRNKDSADFQYNKYVALGGKIEDGESPEQCVIREVEEESGFKLNRPLLKGVLTFDNRGRVFSSNQTSQPNWYVFAYVANEFSGEMKESKEGTLAWVPNSKISGLEMWEGDRLFLPWLDKKGIFSARLLYQDNKLIGHEVVFYG